MDGSESKINRREFLQKGAVVAAGSAALSNTALSYTRITGANDSGVRAIRQAVPTDT